MKRSLKKAANRKLTIIKIMDKDGTISQSDLDRWHSLFKNNDKAAIKAGLENKEIEVSALPVASENDHFITLVKVGDDNYSPTQEDLAQWRDVFEAASADKDFKIFTHQAIDVEVFNINDVVAVE